MLSATLYLISYVPTLLLLNSPLFISTLSFKSPSSLSIALIIKSLRFRVSPTIISLSATSNCGASFRVDRGFMLVNSHVPMNVKSLSSTVCALLSYPWNVHIPPSTDISFCAGSTGVIFSPFLYVFSSFGSKFLTLSGKFFSLPDLKS